MDVLVKQIEKAKPLFEGISRNKYLRAIKDGFVAAMPIVLFSSIFMLLAYVPNIFGFYWSENIEKILLKPYNYSMGILGLVVAGTTAKNFTDTLNRDMPANNKINNISVLLASMVGYLILAVDTIDGGFANGYLGSKGLLTAFVTAFVTGHVYQFCIKRNLTIKMPDSVPPNISQTFKDVIPFGAAVIIFWLFDLAFRNVFGFHFAQGVITFFQPLFTAADGYLGLAIIYGAMALFWFVGIQGPAIVEPAVAAIYYVNIASNLELYQSGQHAFNILTPGVQQFIATLGGTGATLVVPFMFALMAKSKELKSIGKAAAIPGLFGVNEPILFGAPLILNPIFFIPFIGAPIINVWLFKIFVDVLGMNSFMYVLPWTTPAPIGLIMGCGFGLWAIVLAVLLIAVDFVIYYPFFLVYDRQKIAEEAEKAMASVPETSQDTRKAQASEVPQASQTAQTPQTPQALQASQSSQAQAAGIQKPDGISEDNPLKVLVLCAGGGTSGLLANALKKAADEKKVPLISAAGSYGAHMDILKDYQMVILAPQVASQYVNLKKDADAFGIKTVACQGKQYIELTRNPQKALEFVIEQLTQNE